MFYSPLLKGFFYIQVCLITNLKLDNKDSTMGILGNKISRWTEVLRKRRNMNSTVNELHKLTDAELRDIGIKRGDIDTIARGVIDFHRTVRDSESIPLSAFNKKE